GSKILKLNKIVDGKLVPFVRADVV
ncbi:hypothetical protein A2U01_0083068, partial [Trifolium medium]|nr:hypothetical protein [Trifolium medium]